MINPGLRRRRTTDAPSDRGFTLVELLVVVLLFGLVLALAGTLLVNGIKGQQKVVGASQATNDAQVALLAMERAVRNASGGGVRVESDGTVLVTHTGGGTLDDDWRCEAWVYLPPAEDGGLGTIVSRFVDDDVPLSLPIGADASAVPAGWTLAVADVKAAALPPFAAHERRSDAFTITFETQATGERKPGAGVVLKTTVFQREQDAAVEDGDCR